MKKKNRLNDLALDFNTVRELVLRVTIICSSIVFIVGAFFTGKAFLESWNYNLFITNQMNSSNYEIWANISGGIALLFSCLISWTNIWPWFYAQNKSTVKQKLTFMFILTLVYFIISISLLFYAVTIWISVEWIIAATLLLTCTFTILLCTFLFFKECKRQWEIRKKVEWNNDYFKLESTREEFKNINEEKTRNIKSSTKNQEPLEYSNNKE